MYNDIFLGCDCVSAPVILEQPSDTIVARGEPATLNCKVVMVLLMVVLVMLVMMMLVLLMVMIVVLLVMMMVVLLVMVISIMIIMVLSSGVRRAAPTSGVVARVPGWRRRRNLGEKRIPLIVTKELPRISSTNHHTD